ncbi:MAG: hypothetical protein IPM46_10880 [Flavobacteriales bacterium]|nr:hypothetical protein [Flavobacteriales bacterium]
MDTSKEIQFSVFGNKYVLLQELHDDKTHEKRRWLLESEQLNAYLLERALKLKDSSRTVSNSLYRNHLQSITGTMALQVLHLINEGKHHFDDLLGNEWLAERGEDSVRHAIAELASVGFLIEENGEYVVTPDGSAFMSLL